MAPSTTPDVQDRTRFAATCWTLVAAASGEDPAQARAALLQLCLRYWYPVYTFLRRCGHAPVVAEDMSSAFFEDLLSSQSGMPTTLGRFRDHLLNRLHAFLSTDWRETPASPPMISDRPDALALERRHREDADAGAPQDAFHRSYALELIATAHRRLHDEAVQVGREAMFHALVPYLAADPPAGALEPLAQRLSLRPVILAIALKRLRQRFQELVEEELAQTVLDDADLARERGELLLAAMR